jgi:hypothetical protein|nr:MAG TPA: protein of unknown function (DUF1724) [Caudoviricetes sp.]
MIGRYQDFMDYVNMDLWDWTIKEDAPEWAKKQFEEYMKKKNKDN